MTDREYNLVALAFVVGFWFSASLFLLGVFRP